MADKPITFSGQWEYQAVKVDDVPNGVGPSAKLNKLGAECWEAVSMFINVAGGGFTVLMKRKTA